MHLPGAGFLLARRESWPPAIRYLYSGVRGPSKQDLTHTHTDIYIYIDTHIICILYLDMFYNTSTKAIVQSHMPMMSPARFCQILTWSQISGTVDCARTGWRNMRIVSETSVCFVCRVSILKHLQNRLHLPAFSMFSTT